MGWRERLREAAYNTPGGERLTFQFTDLSQSISKKTSAFEFPDASGSYIQNSGHTGRRYPIRAYFTGDDCDLEAEAFDAGLLEPGTGVLEHPVYGRVDVVPFGQISRRDDLVTAANQAVIEVVMWQTLDIVYPSGIFNPVAGIASSIDKFRDSASKTFAGRVITNTATKAKALKSKYEQVLGEVNDRLAPIAATTTEIQRQVDGITESIHDGIDTLIAQPISLAQQTIRLVETPARAATDIGSRLSTYAGIAKDIIGIKRPKRDVNSFAVDEVFAMTAIPAAAQAVVNTQFKTRPQAIAAAEVIIKMFDDLVVWRDEAVEELGFIDTGDSYQDVQEVVAITTAYLVEISFSLAQERTFILDRDRTIIDLCGQLYGSVDEHLDQMIQSNSLNGCSIFELSRGQKIVYYT